MSKNPRDIIIQPLITEKGTRIKEENNGYLFKVDPSANKIEIKKAIEAIFDVSVVKVTTINMKGKPKNLGRYSGCRADWKKAVVQLKDGDAIKAFDVLQ